MGISTSTAQRLVVDAMRELTREPAQQILDIELRKLALMESSIAASAYAGDLLAQSQILRIMERRARFLGTDRLGELNLKHKGSGPNGEMEVTTSIAIEFVSGSGKPEDR